MKECNSRPALQWSLNALNHSVATCSVGEYRIYSSLLVGIVLLLNDCKIKEDFESLEEAKEFAEKHFNAVSPNSRPKLQWNYDAPSFLWSTETIMGRYTILPSGSVGYDLRLNAYKLGEFSFVDDAKQWVETHFDTKMCESARKLEPVTFQFITSLVLGKEGKEHIQMFECRCQNTEEALGKAVLDSNKKFPSSTIRLWAVYKLD